MSSANDSTRGLAAQAIRQVLERQITLDAALAATLSEKQSTLAPAVRSLSYGAVRGHFRHRAILVRLLSQPLESIGALPQAVLGVALYEIEAARSPQYAIVDAAVNAARGAGAGRLSGLINAVLRRYLRERSNIDGHIQADPAARHAFPDWLAQHIRSDWESKSLEIMAQSDRQAPLWLRINPRRITDAAYAEALHGAQIPARRSELVPHAIVLESPCDVRELPGFGAGWVSVQDLGAQCVAFPLALQPGLRVWDACSAPGGKTALIAEREPDLLELVATDFDAQRIPRIAENLARVGVSARIAHADATAPAAAEELQRYDRILLDVPCSAFGVIRRHPDIRLRRQPGDIEKFARQQAAILRASWPKLAPGGRLVYVTCTLARRENHDVIEGFVARTTDAEIVAPDRWEGWPGIGTNDGIGVQILPGEACADGFYYAALTKR